MTEPKPCPFCGERLKYEERVCRALRASGRDVYLKLWTHKKSDCYASLFEVTQEDIESWNRRTNNEP